ncbi:Uncharacterised protein [Salmonella enterica subsp. enterica]|nr:Uncharacterised protein [Salmonella enterica subsp. enterica]
MDNLAIVNFNNPLRLGGNQRIVRHNDHRMSAIAQLAQNRHHLFAGMAIQRAGRLICQNHLSTVHQSAGNTDTLLLSARKL